jgi:lipopolysaccharide biosynthesis glycosyltransferase
LLLDRLLGTEYERVIYIDCDVWICSKAFARLFALDMRGKAIAAVRDATDLVPDARFADYRTRLGLVPDNHYFNSGLMLIDVAKYRSENIGVRALDYITGPDYPGLWYDQDSLNHVVRGNFLEISLLWNWQASLQNRQTSTSSGQVVLHFSGRSKPWNDYLGRLNPIYARMMRSELGNTPWPKFVRSASEVRPWTYRFPRYIKHRILLGSSAARLHRRKLAAAKKYLSSGRFADIEQGLVVCPEEMIG